MTVDWRFRNRSGRRIVALAAVSFAPESPGPRLEPSRYGLAGPPAPRLEETSANDA
jgi:hypothetical protein